MSRTKLRRGLVAVGSAGGLTAVAMLMMLAPAAMAAAPHAVVLKAPYSGTAVSTSDSWSKGGCATAKNTKMATWSAATGKGQIADKASAVNCGGTSIGGVGGSSSGYAGGSFDIAVPIPIAKTGAGKIVVHWSVKANVASSLVAGTCNTGAGTYWSCYQSAYSSIGSYAYVTDLTNGSYFGPSNYWSGIYNDSYNDTYCYSGTCYNYSSTYAFGMSGTPAWFFNGTFDSTHSYALIQYFYAGASAYVSAYNTALTGGSASAVADMGTLGMKATLTSIKIS